MEVKEIKRSFKFIISFILAVSILIFPLDVQADNSLTIPRWLVNSEILENGDLKVVEDITFKFNDKYNGVFREIILDGTDGINNIKISQLDRGNEIPYHQVEHAEKGDNQVFKVNNEGKSIVLQIFSPSEDEIKTFRIEYTVKNVAAKYADTGELYYKFLGDENETPIDFFGINIKMPGKITDKVKIFAHGPTNGKINFSGENMVRAEVEKVPANTFVEVRILFPADFIPNSTNIVNRNAYDDIMEEELSYIQELKDREIKREKRKSIFNNVSIAYSGVLIVALAVAYSKLRRKVNIYELSYSKSYADDSPALVSLLVKGHISIQALMATIFDLARRGFISIEEDNKKKIDSFKLIRMDKEEDRLSNHEKFLIEWLFDKIGDGKIVSSRDIQYYGKFHKFEFNKDYNSWTNMIKEEAKEKGYYDEKARPLGIVLIILSTISLFVSIFSMAFKALFGVLLLIISFVALTYSTSMFWRKSDYGYAQVKKWKNFMEDLKRRSKSLNIEDLALSLDRALIYGLALGIGFDKLNRFAPLVYNSHSPSYWPYWFFLNNSKGENVIEKSLNKSFSTISSSTGSGGGFSAGGGGGAGGGGAGGF
jgi:uncharacterized membrane protein